MSYIFGPVNSRRLGLSLGVDLLPSKICTFDCIYCEVGPTTLLTDKRREYIETAAIIAALDEFCNAPAAPPFDVVTITASGEPTLHAGLGTIIEHVKKTRDTRVAVLTNGSLLHLPEVRQALAAADLIIPSLDAALPRSFQRVNRPCPGMTVERIVEGLIRLREEFTGQIWLEVLLVKGINDSAEALAALNETVQAIAPDRIQLNTVVRPPAVSSATPLSEQEMKTAAGCLDGPVEIIAEFGDRDRHRGRPAAAEEVIEMLHRRPCTAQDICQALNLEPGAVPDLLEQLLRNGRLRKTNHQGKTYYQVPHE